VNSTDATTTAIATLTKDEAMLCGHPLDAQGRPDPDAPRDKHGRPKKACDGVGLVMNTGKKARFGLRYVQCPKCKSTWQVTFKPAEVLARSPPEAPPR
jgi:hypothetical protein